jgi:23S rRNA U2552 (ribose-2'-O)-methylase RlmE/FtsJ
MEFILNLENTPPLFSYSVKSSDFKKLITDNTDLEDTKNKINKIPLDEWKKLRKLYNPYDFDADDCLQVINRAFYKLWEINSKYNIYGNSNTNPSLILHLAEAPGGFLQSSLYLTTKKDTVYTDDEGFTCKKRFIKPNIVTMSLNKKEQPNKSLSSYHNKILKSNVFITYGADNTGDITNLNNIDFIKKFVENKVKKSNLTSFFDIITADGGFDEGSFYNNKEELHYNLILSEIYAAINNNKEDGHFVLKMFDTFTESSVHLLYLLSLYYENIIIYKPKTSRPTNSEKYIICKNFKNIEKTIHTQINTMIKELSIEFRGSYQLFFTLFKIPENFIKQIDEINKDLKNNQINTINNILSIYESEKSDLIYRTKTSVASSKTRTHTSFLKWSEEFNFTILK